MTDLPMASYYEPELIDVTSRVPVTFEITEGGCWKCVSHALRKGHPCFARDGWNGRIGTYLFRTENPGAEGPCVWRVCGNMWCINPDHHEAGHLGRHRKFTDRQAEKIRHLWRDYGESQDDLAVRFNSNTTTISHVITRKGAYRE